MFSRLLACFAFLTGLASVGISQSMLPTCGIAASVCDPASASDNGVYAVAAAKRVALPGKPRLGEAQQPEIAPYQITARSVHTGIDRARE